MSHDDTPTTLKNLIDRASVIEEGIRTGIDDANDETVDALSAQFDEVVSTILSYSTSSFAELKHKCNFVQKFILADHNDQIIVTEVFTKLVQDIEKLEDIYST